MNILKCPVCNKELKRVNNTYKCNNNHSFDISKKGYTNLILANQSFSSRSGDDKESIENRDKFFKLDKYHILKEKLLTLIVKYNNKSEINFLDIACGEGYYTNYLHKSLNNIIKANTYGIDISKYAITKANSKAKELNLTDINYFIANLNKLPFLDNSLDVMLNCFAPIDEKEFFRVLNDEGIYIRVLPGSDHLFGLKKILYDSAYLNIKKQEEIKGLTLLEEVELKDEITLDNKEEILSLFKMTPYYHKTSIEGKTRLSNLDKLTTPISFLIRVYKK